MTFKPEADGESPTICPTTDKTENVSLMARMSHWALLRILIIAAMVLVTVVITPRLLDLAIPHDQSCWRVGLVALRKLLMAAAMVWTYDRAVTLLERRSGSEVNFRPGHLLGGTLLGVARAHHFAG